MMTPAPASGAHTLPGADTHSDDCDLLAYLRQLEQDERIREDADCYNL